MHIVGFLMQRLLFSFLGADIDCCDKMGNAPLHIAARYGHDLLINTLLENGSDPTRYM